MRIIKIFTLFILSVISSSEQIIELSKENLVTLRGVINANSVSKLTRDINLIESFELNSAFDSSKHVTELHVYTLGNTLLRSVSNYLNYRIELGSGGSNEGSSTISLDPQRDAQFYGYGNGGVKLLYIFYNNLFSDLKLGSKLYIKEISAVSLQETA